jgi:predicted nucleic acid-binding protein
MYLDTNVVIYLIEQPPILGSRTYQYIAGRLSQGDQLVLSDLHRFECLVRPLAIGDQVLKTRFDRFFATAYVHFAPVTSSICERAAAIRASHQFGPLDSLHLATSIDSACDVFLTNDKSLSSFTAIKVELLP